jgi:hypothetical protein
LLSDFRVDDAEMTPSTILLARPADFSESAVRRNGVTPFTTTTRGAYAQPMRDGRSTDAGVAAQTKFAIAGLPRVGGGMRKDE